MVTAETLAKMDAHQLKVRILVEDAEDEAQSRFAWGMTDAQAQVAGTVRQARSLYQAWSDGTSAKGKRRWAIEGLRDDGARYLLVDWFKLGDEIGALAAQVTGDYYGAGVWSSLVNTVTATATDTAKAVEVVVDTAKGAAEVVADAGKALAAPWSVGTKVALWGGGGVVAALAAGYLLRQVRGLKETAS